MSARDGVQLLQAARAGCEAAVEALLAGGADVNARGATRLTALHLSAKHGHLRVTRLLVARGAGLEAKEEDGWTPLHLAVKYGHEEVADLLMGEGADPTAPYERGRGSVHLAADKAQPWFIRLAGRYGRSLVSETDDDAATPLHIGANVGHRKVVEVLIEEGAGLDAKDRWGRTALHLASMSGHSEVVDVLLRNGASMTERDGKGRTALHWAAKYGHSGAVNVLTEVADRMVLAAGGGLRSLALFAGNEEMALRLSGEARKVTLDTEDSLGKTPLFYACEGFAGYTDRPESPGTPGAVSRDLVRMFSVSHKACALALVSRGFTQLGGDYIGHSAVYFSIDGRRASGHDHGVYHLLQDMDFVDSEHIRLQVEKGE